jgi:hypothetical protein
MHDPADDPTIIDPLNAPNIGWQMRLDPSPLLVAQPKEILAHDPGLPANQVRIESQLPSRSSIINEFRP